MCAVSAAQRVCLWELQAPPMPHGPSQGVCSPGGSGSSPAVSGCLRGAASQGRGVGCCTLRCPEAEVREAGGNRDPVGSLCGHHSVSWGWRHREGMGSPTAILLALTRFSFAQLHTCKERREGAEHPEHPPGAQTAQGTQHPIRIPICPAQPCPTVPWSNGGEPELGGSWKELGQWEWVRWALGGMSERGWEGWG